MRSSTITITTRTYVEKARADIEKYNYECKNNISKTKKNNNNNNDNTFAKTTTMAETRLGAL